MLDQGGNAKVCDFGLAVDRCFPQPSVPSIADEQSMPDEGTLKHTAGVGT